tara:strand:+ start:26261 stop:27304 length:1044 start_codon:yes stop_codon:yes gene_type:complete
LKLLVTGGAGFIGSAFIREAISRKFSVLNLDSLTYASSKASLETISKNKAYSFVKLDIRDRNSLYDALKEFSPDRVIHFAAETHVDKSIDSPVNFIETNIIGTFNLLDCANKYWKDAGKPSTFRFLHISTDEVYGSLGSKGMFKETTKYDPSSPYSASKASSDHLVRAWGKTFNFPILITNCSNNYGPFQFPEKLIPVVLNKALAGESIPIYGNGKNVRDWLFVEDHVDALLTVLDSGDIGRSYNIGGNSEVSNIDLVTKICKILDIYRPKSNSSYDSQITFVEDRPGHDFRYAIDSSRIRKELGWKPKYSFDEGIKKTILWYLENERWWKDLLRQTQLTERQGKIK